MSFVFVSAGVAAALFALIAVTRENPIYAALFTLLTLAGVAVEFALLSAPFLAAMQILLYAGAIMVLFVFVIMLLSLKKEEHGEEPPLAGKVFAGAAALGVLLFLFVAINAFPGHSDWSAPDQEAKLAAFSSTKVAFGSVDHFGQFLYGSSLVPFELASVLITAAVAGVVLLARRRAPGSPELEIQPRARRPREHEGPEPPEPQALAAADISLAAGAHEVHR
jgi:NADH-quinone oxidoreductase subunit J